MSARRGFAPSRTGSRPPRIPCRIALSPDSTTGLCGYLGSSPWSYQDYPDDRLYDPDKPAHKVTYPDEFGNPIPTLAWEAHRAGIDDVRYLEALDRSIAAARKRLEQPNPPEQLTAALNATLKIRRDNFESISGRWFEYLCRISPGDLEHTRRRPADATVKLDRLLAASRQQQDSTP